MFLRAVLALLPLDGNDALREEAMITVQTIAEALPDEQMKRQFLSAEALRVLKQ